MSDDILSQQDGPILRITLNRPDAGNGATDAMAVELTRLLDGAAEKSRLAVLRGAGKDFCIGRATMGQQPAVMPEALVRKRQYDVVFNAYAAIRNAPIPVISVVQGRALGFGCAIAALCDITIASDASTFQIPEMEHYILPTMVLSAMVDRMTRKGLSYMVYSCATVGPERALSHGIVSEVVPAAKLDETVEALCKFMLKAPAVATEGVKEYLRRAMTMDVPSAVDFARNLHAVVNSSSEMRRK
jgi:enoyl-CoA hydratase/carnithine racemase